jgi:stage II sporulation protein D
LQIEAGEFGQELLGERTFTAGGGVDTMVIGGTEFRGTQLRQLLGLRSTVFQMTVVGNHVIITTRGFGHRVGMSQCGAQIMALEGCTYREILLHYYKGVSLENLDAMGIK